MKISPTSQVAEPASAQARSPLPCRADRQKIVDEAELVLAEARAIVEQSDRRFLLLLWMGPANAKLRAPRPSFHDQD